MGRSKIVHYLAWALAVAASTAAASDAQAPFDPRPLLRQVQANVALVQALESPARGTGQPTVLRCVMERIRESRNLLDDVSRLASRMAPGDVQVAALGDAPLDVPARVVPQLTVMVAGVKSVSESSALVAAARRCFAVSEDTEMRWLPAVETAPVSTISALGRR